MPHMMQQGVRVLPTSRMQIVQFRAYKGAVFDVYTQGIQLIVLAQLTLQPGIQ